MVATTIPPTPSANSGSRSPRLQCDTAAITSDRRNVPVALCSISGLGHYLPEVRLTNDEIGQRLGVDGQWIHDRTGIRERRQATADESTSDLAFAAAKAALIDARVEASDLDLIIVATLTPDQQVPTVACMLQAKLGCTGVPAMDLGATCAGYGYAVHLAGSLVRCGMHRRILVVGAETMHAFVNPTDKQTGMLFGDGAGAAVVTAEGRFDVLYSKLGADGSDADLIQVKAGGSRRPATAETVAAGEHFIEMRGREVFRAAVRQMADCIRQAADAMGIEPSGFDLVVPHQANARIIEAVGQELGLAADRVVCDVEETGNTCAASIPIAITRARQAGRIQPGMLLVTVGFGGGTTWACQVIRVN